MFFRLRILLACPPTPGPLMATSPQVSSLLWLHIIHNVLIPTPSLGQLHQGVAGLPPKLPELQEQVGEVYFQKKFILLILPRGPSPLPQLQLSLAPSSPVLGGRIQVYINKMIYFLT